MKPIMSMQLSQLAGPPKPISAATAKDDLKLKKSCQDFEAVLINQMMSKMRETVQKSTLFGSREQEDMFQGMLDEEMSKDMSKSGSLKIADLLYSQLKRSEIAKVPGASVDK